MNVLVQQHDIIVHVTHSICWESEIREEFQIVELFGDFSLEDFALHWVAVAGREYFRNWCAADEAVVRNFVQIWLRIDVVELLVVVDFLQAQIAPEGSLRVNAVHDRVLNAKSRKKKINFTRKSTFFASNLSHGASSGSILGHGSPKSVLSVKAAPSANDSKQ